MNFERSEVVPIRTQKVPQNIETPVTFAAVPNAYVRYAYARSSESMNAQTDGQDYLCFKHNDQRLVFVVCDGVGSSFCGNLAARILGDNLLDWLWALDIEYLGGEAALVESATAYLNNKLQKQAQLEVEEYEIPGSDQMNALILQALNAQRAYGSEAIFVAGRIDHPGPMMIDGLASFIWMGDSQLHLYDRDEQEIDIDATWTSGNRFSTVQGTKGTMSGWMQPWTAISRVTAFSDGLTAHVEGVAGYSDTKLDREIHIGSRLATSDDVSFIDIVLRTPTYEGYPHGEIPDRQSERPHLQSIWNPKGSDSFELTWNWPADKKASFLIQEARNPALADAVTHEVIQGQTSWRPQEDIQPGVYYYRVRAVPKRGPLTPWSELRHTKVAYPPPAAPTLTMVDVESTSPTLNWTEEGDALDYMLERSTDSAFTAFDIVYEGRGTNWVQANTIEPNTYFFRVRAISDGGPSAYSEQVEVEITLPPPPVPQLGVAGFGGASGYELRWQSSPGATYYEVEQADLNSDDIEVSRVDDIRYHVAGNNYGEFAFRVRACHQYGCSDWSNPQEIYIVPPAPMQAPSLRVEDADDEGNTRFVWSEVANATRYEIESAATDTFVDAATQSTDKTSIDFDTSNPGKLLVRVRAVNKGGRGPWSTFQMVTTTPEIPAWIEAKADDEANTIELGWASVAGLVDYRLEMRDASSTRTIYFGEETHHTFDLAEINGREALFRIRAEVDSNIYSDWQVSDALAVGAGQGRIEIAMPQLDDQGQIKLNWNTVANADHYEVDTAMDATFTNAKTQRVSTTSATIYAAAAGTYHFRARAVIKGRPAATSQPVSIEVIRSTAPQMFQPATLNNQTTFELTWRGVPGTDYYEFQESRSPDFTEAVTHKAKIFHPSQKVALPMDKRLGSTFHYRVRSVGKDEQPSPWSNVVSFDVK